MKTSIESGRRSIKLWLLKTLIELFIFGICTVGIGYFIYLIAKLVESYQ